MKVTDCAQSKKRTIQCRDDRGDDALTARGFGDLAPSALEPLEDAYLGAPILNGTTMAQVCPALGCKERTRTELIVSYHRLRS